MFNSVFWMDTGNWGRERESLSVCLHAFMCLSVWVHESVCVCVEKTMYRAHTRMRNRPGVHWWWSGVLVIRCPKGKSYHQPSTTTTNNKIAQSQCDKKQTCWSVSKWRPWREANVFAGNHGYQRLISPTSSYCLKPSLLRCSNENRHRALPDLVMPFCLNDTAVCAWT